MTRQAPPDRGLQQPANSTPTRRPRPSGDAATKRQGSTWTTVSSSLIARIAYAPDATLDVELRTGALYRYFLVPRSVADALLDAESKGEYFNRHIRNRFHFQQLA